MTVWPIALIIEPILLVLVSPQAGLVMMGCIALLWFDSSMPDAYLFIICLFYTQSMAWELSCHV